MFELVDGLCQRYTSLTPFMIWEMPAGKIYYLIRRIRASSKPQTTNSNTNVQTFTNDNSPQRINVTGKRGTGGWI